MKKHSLLLLLVLFLALPACAQFPSTGVLDNFNRADEGPPPSSNWMGPIFDGDNDMRVVSNEVVQESGLGVGGSWWSASTFGPDTEAFVRMNVLAGNNDLVLVFARIVDPGASTMDGYIVSLSIAGGPDVWKISRVDNLTVTDLGATFTQEMSLDDSIGIEIIGSTIAAWYNNGTSWSSLASRTDSTYSDAGSIGIQFEDNQELWDGDDFGGGTVIPAPAVARRPVVVY